jgi:tetratricopeptide (TPR) repeat protein
MPQPSIEQLRTLPRLPEETWQGALFQMPALVDDRKGKPYRPWAGLWAAVVGGQAHPCLREDRADQREPLKLWQGLIEFATHPEWGGHLPGRIEVREADLAEMLRSHVTELGIEVVLVDKLPYLDELLGSLVKHLDNAVADNPIPGIFSGRGITLAHVRAFAEAAEAFFRAAPWQHLMDADLLTIEVPSAPDGMRHAAVLGAGGETFGLAFYHDPDDCYAMLRTGDKEAWFAKLKRGLWQCTFSDVSRTPLADVEVWEEHHLPLAAVDAYPCLMEVCPNPRKSDQDVGRADAPRLAFVEGLLRVLAQTTEGQMDTGRWSMTVPTAVGPMDFTFALPDLLNPPDFKTWLGRGYEPDRRSMERMHAQIGRFLQEQQIEDIDDVNKAIAKEFVGKTLDRAKYPPRNPLEQATELCFDAIDAKGRRQLQLIRQALAIYPDCAEAYVLLGERQSDTAKASDLYAQGVAAGERALGKQRFEEDAGQFWGQGDTRPYMRARFGLAQTLAATGRLPEAMAHYRELLRLNPGDNQGVRYLYLPALLELGEDAEAARYMKQAPPEGSATWAYTRALLAFRLGGDCPAARDELAKALDVNPAVPDALLSEDGSSQLPASYAPGSMEEALVCAREVVAAYSKTPGALAWLKTASPTLAKSARPRRIKQRKRRSR